MSGASSRLSTAHAYARRGWHVFPLAWPTEAGCSCGDPACTSPAKHPLGKLAPHGLKDATTDPEQITAWWTAAPLANIGLPTEASGLVVLDVDPRHGGDRSLELLEAIVGKLETATVHTGGGGLHFLFAANGTPILSRPLDKERYPGLDVKACGGYIVAAGSDHASGKRYVWAGSSAPKPIPDALLKLLPKRDTERAKEPTAGTGPTSSAGGGKIPDGQRNDTLTIFAGKLRHDGCDEAEIAAHLLVRNQRCEHPLTEREVREIAASVAKYPAGLSDEELRARRVTLEVERERARREARRRLDAEERGALAEPEIRTLADRLANPLPPVRWRIERFHPADARVMLVAQFKGGKTTLRDNWVRSLVDGDPFLGREPVTPTTGNVAVLDLEMGARQMDDWLCDQRIEHSGRVIPIPLRGKAATFNILDDGIRAQWATRFRDHGITYPILDCLRPALDALGLDEHGEAGRFLVAFDALLAEAGITEALVIHHMGHSNERARGDSRLRDWPDVEIRLVRQSDDPASPRFLAAYGRDVDQRECALDYDPTTRRLTLAGGDRRDAAAREALADVLAVLEPSGDGASGRTILSNLADSGHTRTTLTDAIRLGIRTGGDPHGPGNQARHSPLARDWSAPVNQSAPGVLRRTGESECASAPVRIYTHAHCAHTNDGGELIECAVALSRRCLGERQAHMDIAIGVVALVVAAGLGLAIAAADRRERKQ